MDLVGFCFSRHVVDSCNDLQLAKVQTVMKLCIRRQLSKTVCAASYLG